MAFADLIPALAEGATVVTPNRRLAAAVRRAFDQYTYAQGQVAWIAADVLPWSAWLERAFNYSCLRGHTDRVLLTRLQARALWHRVIADTPEGRGLLRIDMLADTASEAWELAHAWHLLSEMESIPVSEETRAFLGWARAYDALSTAESLTDQARLADLVRELVVDGRVPPPVRLVVLGFDAVSPQQQALLAALRSRGVTVEQLAQTGTEGRSALMRHSDVLHELRTAALWARSCLTANSEARIGVVVPHLERVRAATVRIFDEVFEPGAQTQPGRAPLRPWNISLGTPLSDWPLTYAALLILELASRPISLHRAGVLLRSAFVGGAQSERNARALLDGRLRRLGNPRITLDELIDHASAEGFAHSCGLLAERLILMRARLREMPSAAQPVSFWGPALQSLLSALQWPGDRELSSEEYQTFERWKDLMASLARLDLVTPAMKLPLALETLRQLAADEVFQPQTPEVPVQVMGVLESAQLEFDHLLVLGLSDAAWPRPARPNPLLPLSLLRSRGVPRASAESELAFARRTQSGWLRAAPHVLFSYHSADGDATLGSSPLLAGLPETTLTQLSVENLSEWRIAAWEAARLEQVADWHGASLDAGAKFRGGARLLQDQAACPFRAFAIHRLGAISLEDPHEGLDARDRGVLLHGALFELWSTLGTSKRLQMMAPEDLRTAIASAVEAALKRLRRKRTTTFQPRLLDLERARLYELLEEWLVVEQRRGQFQVIACEEQAELNVGGLALGLRLDRVDALPQGGELVIDYKTGDSSITKWMGERPDEPQLPLYCLAREPSLSAAAFAQVRRGECLLSGLSAYSGVSDGIGALTDSKFAAEFRDWPALLGRWRAVLDALAVQFRSGAAPVAPKKRPETCRNCDLGVLCRVSEVVDQGAPSPEQDVTSE